MTLLVDDRRGKAGHRAAATEDCHACLPGMFVKAVDAVDEEAAIGQVAVIHASGDAGLGHSIGLALERASGVDHPIDV